MNYNIAVIPGDGIGPDIVEQAVKVMHKVGDKFGHTFTTKTVLAGGAAIDAVRVDDAERCAVDREVVAGR